jgi:hypothetical protein
MDQGYCPNCLTNVEHVRVINSRALCLLDRATLGVSGLFGFGPWFCISCGSRRFLFPPYRRGAGSYDPRAREPKPQSIPEIEAIGNVFISSVSLVQRSERARNYSEKFRDGVAEQLLACQTTFSQVREQLGVTDLDLQDWLARYHVKRSVGRTLSVAPVPDRQASSA